MPPKNDQNTTTDKVKSSDSSASLENSVQNPEEITADIATAAESLDQNPATLDPNLNQGDQSAQSIFSTIETINSSQQLKKPNRIISYIKHLDSYILVFLLIVIVVVLMIFYLIEKNRITTPTTAKTQTLSQSTLSQLNSNNVLTRRDAKFCVLIYSCLFLLTKILIIYCRDAKFCVSTKYYVSTKFCGVR